MKTKCIRAAALLCCLMVLTGCVRGKNEEKKAAATLLPARVSHAAPDGDRPVGETQDWIIYASSPGEMQLVSLPVTLEPADLYDTARILIQQQLATENEYLNRGSGNRRELSLYTGSDPLEISGGICTVNLAPTALQLSYSELYKACIALATTLCEMEEISFVNVLVADQSIGLDITGSLAMGTLTAHPEENLPVLWEQMEARRAPLGADLGKTSLSSLVTLYRPLEEGLGIGCETRMMAFEGQTPQQIASGLLNALAEQGRGAEPLMDLLLHEPLTSELEDGGRLITLSFREDTEERLKAQGTDMACLMASITCTLTSFIPGVAAVCVRIGDKPITEINSRHFGTVTVLGGLLKRSAMAQLLRGSASLFFALDGQLSRCETPVDRQLADSPRAQLGALMAGPSEARRAEGLAPTLPEGVREDDILGIASEGDLLLVNLSESFRSEIQAAGKEAEFLLCYSMVNTLCANSGLKRVCFFFEGEQVEWIAGTLYWAGEFLWNPGLGDQGLG